MNDPGMSAANMVSAKVSVCLDQSDVVQEPQQEEGIEQLFFQLSINKGIVFLTTNAYSLSPRQAVGVTRKRHQ
ncbi:hypothetical protein H4Q26_003058 [Puccinia striiformis f. sp. tritici PST-130]|nr:hypothetical protein H4Q26_003058 [Puccinia striiformis f. sp. tritici PST-130]